MLTIEYFSNCWQFINILQANEQHGRSSSVSLSNKKCVRGSPKASSARELIEKKNNGGSREEKAATLPRKGTIYAKRESCNNAGRRVSSLPRNSQEDVGSVDSLADMTADTIPKACPMGKQNLATSLCKFHKRPMMSPT